MSKEKKKEFIKKRDKQSKLPQEVKESERAKEIWKKVQKYAPEDASHKEKVEALREKMEQIKNRKKELEGKKRKEEKSDFQKVVENNRWAAHHNFLILADRKESVNALDAIETAKEDLMSSNIVNVNEAEAEAAVGREQQEAELERMEEAHRKGKDPRKVLDQIQEEYIEEKKKKKKSQEKKTGEEIKEIEKQIEKALGGSEPSKKEKEEFLEKLDEMKKDKEKKPD